MTEAPQVVWKAWLGTQRKRVRRQAAIAFLFVGLAAPGVPGAPEQPVTCTTCHAQEAGDLSQSVHVSFSCEQCHGGEDAYPLSSAEAEAFGRARGDSRPSFDHGPSFRGKPDRAKIPELCGTCHADVERMNRYGLRTDQLARYWTSGHGKTLAATGDVRVAVCVDCHGSHRILPGHEPGSRTHPLNVPDTCSICHADTALMDAFDLSVEVVDEYRQSVHGKLVLEQQDTGAPTCATCHGNHSAMPPGFATVGAVCGRCHQNAAKTYAASVHAGQPEFNGCVLCHGGGEDSHAHLIERITRPPGLMIQRWARLRTRAREPTPEEITERIHPESKRIMDSALPKCLDCHDEPEEDESLRKFFGLLETVAEAERRFVRTGERLVGMGQGVLLVDAQRFLFEDAKTHLIELAPLQHSLDETAVGEKVTELVTVCDQVDVELDGLEQGLAWRHRALLPIWVFAVVFAALLYAKYKQLKAIYVKPLPYE